MQHRLLLQERIISMEIQVLGGGRDVGRSCFLLKTATSQLLLDCGAHPGYADERRFPDFSSISDLTRIDAILITHFHLDHAAALPYLTETLNCTAPVYMTEPTKDLTRLMLQDFISTCNARHQHCPFGTAQIERCLRKVRFLKLEESAVIADKITVTSYYAGHALGAVMLNIQVDEMSVLYSGDYVTQPDRHLNAASVPYGLCPDLFITEATYCSHVRKESRIEQEDELMSAIIAAVQKGGKVLVPISAFGRVQAVCGIFESHPDSDILSNVPMYIVAGLASKANDVYRRYTTWTVQGSREGHQAQDQALDKTPERSFLSKLRSFNKKEHWDLLHVSGPMILFATPGSMSTGLSRDVFQLWAGDDKNVVLIPGVAFSHGLTSKLLSRHDVSGDVGVDVKCRLVNIAFNSHVDARGIVRMCRKVMPRAVMLVHGDDARISEFHTHITSQLGMKCFAPSNGDVVKFEPTSCKRILHYNSLMDDRSQEVSPEIQAQVTNNESEIRAQITAEQSK